MLRSTITLYVETSNAPPAEVQGLKTITFSFICCVHPDVFNVSADTVQTHADELEPYLPFLLMLTLQDVEMRCSELITAFRLALLYASLGLLTGSVWFYLLSGTVFVKGLLQP